LRTHVPIILIISRQACAIYLCVCVRVTFACGAGFAAASSFMVKDKRMPLMNEIVDVLEAVTEDVEEWVVCICAQARVHMHRPMRAHIHVCVLHDVCLRASIRC